VQILHVPGTTSFLLLVNNQGNTEDAYTATITGMRGPVTANLLGLDGQPTMAIPIFRLPGLSSAAILLQTDLAASGTGVVDVQVRSLSDDTEVVDTSVLVTAGVAPVPEPVPSPPPAASSVTDLVFALQNGNGLGLEPGTPNLLGSEAPASLGGVLTLLSGLPRPLLDGAEAETLIQGRVVLDDTGGTGLAGVTVIVRPTSPGANQSEIRTALTDDRGQYEFRDLPMGSYEVDVALPPALRPTGPADGRRAIKLVPGKEVVTGVNFGATRPTRPVPQGTPKGAGDGGVDKDLPAPRNQDPNLGEPAPGDPIQLDGQGPCAEAENGRTGLRGWLVAGSALVSSVYARWYSPQAKGSAPRLVWSSRTKPPRRRRQWS
jgi:hypothetical protein